MSEHLPTGHPPVPKQKIGVLLLNLGTPDATDYWSMRRYLKQFLSDRRVIETPRLVWWFVLNLIVLTTRPRKSGALYDAIWDRTANDSPLRVIARSQAEKLAQRLKSESDADIIVDFAMRYGNPSTASRLLAMKAQGCTRILLVPLYPQYSAPTTATANDHAFDALKTMRWQPAIRTAPAYFDSGFYIDALTGSVKSAVSELGFTPDLVITSYHGMPRSYLEKGDPYHCHCQKTTRLLREALGWEKDRIMVTFQSRFGPEEWLQPYTDMVLGDLPKKGIRKVAIVAPAFSVDCLETLEEIAITGRRQFLSAGGEHFAYIPCLNDSEPGMDVIEHLVRRELGGWIN